MSGARGQALPSSDADLLLVYRCARKADLHRLAGLSLELHAYTEEEAQALGASAGKDARGGAAFVPRDLTNRLHLGVGWSNGQACDGGVWQKRLG